MMEWFLTFLLLVLATTFASSSPTFRKSSNNVPNNERMRTIHHRTPFRKNINRNTKYSNLPNRSVPLALFIKTSDIRLPQYTNDKYGSMKVLPRGKLRNNGNNIRGFNLGWLSAISDDIIQEPFRNSGYDFQDYNSQVKVNDEVAKIPITEYGGTTFSSTYVPDRKINNYNIGNLQHSGKGYFDSSSITEKPFKDAIGQEYASISTQDGKPLPMILIDTSDIHDINYFKHLLAQNGLVLNDKTIGKSKDTNKKNTSKGSKNILENSSNGFEFATVREEGTVNNYKPLFLPNPNTSGSWKGSLDKSVVSPFKNSSNYSYYPQNVVPASQYYNSLQTPAVYKVLSETLSSIPQFYDSAKISHGNPPHEIRIYYQMPKALEEHQQAYHHNQQKQFPNTIKYSAETRGFAEQKIPKINHFFVLPINQDAHGIQESDEQTGKIRPDMHNIQRVKEAHGIQGATVTQIDLLAQDNRVAQTSQEYYPVNRLNEDTIRKVVLLEESGNGVADHNIVREAALTFQEPIDSNYNNRQFRQYLLVPRNEVINDFLHPSIPFSRSSDTSLKYNNDKKVSSKNVPFTSEDVLREKGLSTMEAILTQGHLIKVNPILPNEALKTEVNIPFIKFEERKPTNIRKGFFIPVSNAHSQRFEQRTRGERKERYPGRFEKTGVKSPADLIYSDHKQSSDEFHGSSTEEHATIRYKTYDSYETATPNPIRESIPESTLLKTSSKSNFNSFNKGTNTNEGNEASSDLPTHYITLKKLTESLIAHNKNSSQQNKNSIDGKNQTPKYHFRYDVINMENGDVKSHEEERVGDITKGKYSLYEPNGTVRTVNYKVSTPSGFKAVLERSGKPMILKPKLINK